MTSINVKITGATIVAEVDGKITSGMVGLPVYIQYDESWNDLTKTAYFRVGKLVRKREPIGTATTVPWELLRSHGIPLQIGVEGKTKSGDIVIPTIWATVDTILEGASGDIPAAPNPDSGDDTAGGGAVIDDSVTTPGKTWSSQKISDEIEGLARIDDPAIGGDTWSSKNIVDRLCPGFTESGAVVSCDPVAEYPLEVVSHIRPVQAGSGDPYPPGGGGNLLPFPYSSVSITSSNGISITTKADGSITFVGTATNDVYYWLDNAITEAKLPAGTYYLSATGIGGLGIEIAAYKNNNYVTTVRWGIGAFTLDYSTYDKLRAFLVCRSGKTVNETIYPQIEVGSTPTAYVPYSNIRPITGYTAVKLTRCGKNLSQYKSSDEANSSGHINYYGLYGRSGITITVSADITREDTTLTTNGAMRFYIYYTDGERTTGSASYGAEKDGQPHKKVITLTADATKTIDYLRLIPVTNNVTGDRADHIQIEIGALATAYEPYRGDTFTLDLGQTVYGGSLNWQTGELTVEHGIQDLSALVWYGPEVAYSNRIYYTEPFPAAASPIAGGRKGWCSVFNCLNGITLGALPNNSLAYSISEFSASVRVYISADEIADVDALMAVLEGQTLVYQLATPITIQLAPQEILALSGTNNLYSLTGDTDVAGKADPVEVITDLKARIAALETAVVSNT